MFSTLPTGRDALTLLRSHELRMGVARLPRQRRVGLWPKLQTRLYSIIVPENLIKGELVGGLGLLFFGGVEFLGLDLDRTPSDSFAQVVELGSAYLAGFLYFDFLDCRRSERENFLYPYSP